MRDIDAVGFDLDNTLYKSTSQIDDAIRKYACEKAGAILSRSYEDVRREFESYLVQTNSGSKALQMLGVSDGKLIMQEALEMADIAPLLSNDLRLVDMIERLNKNLLLFLITGSGEKVTQDKLTALGVNPDLFRIKLCGGLKLIRDDGSAFIYVSQQLRVPYERMTFVGDRENVDILPAKNLGIRTAIVNARSANADYQLEDIYSLEKLLL